MNRNTLIEHKEVVVVCEENGPISLSYNALLTTLEANTVVEHVVHVVTIQSTLTCTNYGKINHSMATCHNRKIEVLVILTITIKSIEHVAKTKTQPVKLGRIHVRYPYIICSNAEHRSRECPKKIEVHNMFRTQLISSNAMIAPKPPKIDNVPINVVVVVITCN
jgi:hypothetical protein